MTIDNNPFERWNLDPNADERELTEQMRRLSRTLPPDERDELQRDWRKLTSDPVEQARWTLLTPPPVTDGADMWQLAEKLVSKTEEPELPPLVATLEDGLVLPLMNDNRLYAKPPFLPEILRRKRNRSSVSDHLSSGDNR